MVAEPKPPLVPLRGDSPIERPRAAARRRRRLMRERSTIRRGREVTRDRLNGNSERRTDRKREAAGAAKVGTSREGAVAPHTYRFIRFYSSPLRPSASPPPSTTSKTRRAQRGRGRRGSRTMAGLFQVPSVAARSSVARTRSKPGSRTRAVARFTKVKASVFSTLR